MQTYTINEIQERLIDYRGRSVPKSNDGVPLITAKNIRKGFIDFSATEFISEQNYNQWTSKGYPQTDDVLITTEAPLGMVALFPKGKYAIAQRVICIRPKPNLIDPKYLKYFLLSHEGQKRLYRRSSGSTALGIKQSELRKVEIDLLSLGEQKKIAQILSTWDEAIKAIEELTKRKKELKKSLLYSLVIGNKKLKGYEHSKWKLTSLGNVGDVFSGGTPSTVNESYWNGKVAWCTPTDITSLKGKRKISITKRTITDKGLAKSSANLLPKNSIIICTRATIGDTAINTIPMATNQGFKSIVPNNQVNYQYLYYLVLTLKKYFIRYSSGSTFLELSKKDFSKTPITIPTNLVEQESIENIMVNIDEQIELLLIKLSFLKKQKKGLMQKLLTGKVRIN